MMSSPHFKVKALYDYSSEYDDDLNFLEGTIITVTNVEDAEWYSGTYTNPSTGETLSGIFPQNFVELYEEPTDQLKEEPEAKVSEEPVTEGQEVLKMDISKHPEEPSIVPQLISENTADKEIKQKSAIIEPGAESESAAGFQRKHSNASDCEKAGSTSAIHKNALFNKIAAFNSPEAAPILPSINALDEKPNKRRSFVGVPSSYVPPSFGPKKTNTFDSISSNEYKSTGEDEPARESRASFDQEEAEKEAQPKLSLKERIALLQKRQKEEAEREAAMVRKKAEKKKLKKNHVEAVNSTLSRTSTCSEKGVDSTQNEDLVNQDRTPDQNTITELKDHDNHGDKSKNDYHVNGELTTEASAGHSVEENDEDMEYENTLKEKETEDEKEQDDDNEEDDDEEDEEEMRKRELRERMAKLSGGAGMFGMMGMSPFGNALPKHKKKSKSANEKTLKAQEEDDDFADMPKAIPILPMPGNPTLPKNLENMLSSVDSTGESASGASEIKDDIDVESFNRDLEEDSKEEQVYDKELNKSIDVGYSEEEDETEDAINEQILKKESLLQDDLEFFDADEKEKQPADNELQTFTEADKKLLPEDDGVQMKQSFEDNSALLLGTFNDREGENVVHKDVTISGQKHDYIDRNKVVHSAPPLPPQSVAPSLPSLEQEGDTVPLGQLSSFDSQTFDVSSNKVASLRQSDNMAPALPTLNPPPAVEVTPLEPQLDIAPAIPIQFRSSAVRATPPGPPHDAAPAIPALHLPPMKKAAPPEPPYNVAPTIPKQDRQSTSKSVPPEPPHIRAPALPSDDAPNFEGYNMAVATDDEERSHHHHHGQQHHHHVSSSDIGGQELTGSEPYKSIPTLTTATEVIDSVVHVDENKDWYVQNKLPPSLQDQVNKTLIYEIQERKPKTRSGLDIVEKDFYILMVDHDKYLQKLVSVRYEENNSDNSSFHIADIPVLDEDPSSKYGLELYSLAVKYSGHSIDPSLDFVTKLFGKIPSILPSIGLVNFGKLLYVNESHEIIKPCSSFQPGDIISIYNARFTGHNKLRQKITYDVGVNRPMIAIISEFDPAKQKFRVLEKDSKSKVKPVSYKIADMQVGTIKVFRPVGRDYVGW